jgi:hypothetical protein
MDTMEIDKLFEVDDRSSALKGAHGAMLLPQHLSLLRSAFAVPGKLAHSREAWAKTVLVKSGVMDALAASRPEAEKTTVLTASEEVPRPKPRRRKASPKAVALLERFKNVPSVDPNLLREDIDRVLDTQV